MFKEFNVRNSDTIWKAKVMGGTGVSIPLWYSILDGLHASGYELVDFIRPTANKFVQIRAGRLVPSSFLTPIPRICLALN